MTHEEFRAARLRLGLSTAKLADMLGLSGGGRSVRKYETRPGEPDHRPVSGPVIRLMEAFESGWRPKGYEEQDGAKAEESENRPLEHATEQADSRAAPQTA